MVIICIIGRNFTFYSISFTGIVDVLQLIQLNFGNEGRTCTKTPLTGDILEQTRRKRDEIIDILSGFDDVLAESIISSGSMEVSNNATIVQAIRKATLDRHVVPVFLGSAYKNCGVQPLMNAIVDYLPAPWERNQIFDCFE